MESFFKQFNIDPNQSDLYRKALTHRSYVHQHSISKSDDLPIGAHLNWRKNNHLNGPLL